MSQSSRKHLLRRRGRRLAVAVCRAIALGSICIPSTGLGGFAYWDSSPNTAFSPLDGSGTWDLTSPHWYVESVDYSWQQLGGYNAVFGDGNAYAGTVTLGANVNVVAINFNDPGSGNYYIAPTAGDSITLTGNSSTGITVASGLMPNIGAALSGSSPLVIYGPGTLVLTGSNTNSGGTNVSAGTLITGSLALGIGPVSVASGATLASNGSAGFFGNVTNNGTFNIATGTTLAVGSGYSFNQTAGTLNINGQLFATNFNFGGGTINGQVLFNGANASLTLGSGIGTGTGNFLFTGQNTSDLLSSGTIPANVSITIRPNSSSGSLYYASSGALTNNGTISLISANNSYVGFSVGSQFTNNGTLSFSAGGAQSTSVDSISTSGVTNNGVININANTSTYSNVTNNGTFSVAAGQIFSVGSSNIFNQAGGTLNVNGQMSVSNFNFGGGIINGQVLFNGNTGSLTLGSGIGTGTGHFLFTGQTTSNLFAAGTIPANVSITVQPNSSSGSLYYSSSGPLTNNGTISLISANNSYVGLSVGSQFTNNGTLSFSAGGAQSTSVDSISTSGVTNNGVININANTSTYSNVTNNETFTIATGQIFSVGSSNIFNQAGGTLNVNGQMSVSNFNFGGGTINGQVLFNGTTGALTLGSGIGTGTGNFLFTGQSTSDLYAAGTIPSGINITVHPNSSSGSLYYASSGALTNNGTISLISANNSYVGLSVGSQFTNNGTLSFSAGGVQSTSVDSISTSGVTNNGVININANTSTYSNVTNNETFTIATGQIFSVGSSNIFNQAGGTLNINGQMSVSNFNFGGGTINGQVLFNGTTGALTLGSGIGTGTGNFLFTGQSTSDLYAAGTIPSGINITVHPNSSSGSLYYASGGALANNGTISLISASNSYVGFSVGSQFTNNGTLSFSAGGAQSTSVDSISTSGVTNNGVININANTSTYSNVTNNETFTIATGQIFSVGSSNAFNQANGQLIILGQMSVSNFNFSGGNILGTVLFNGAAGALTLGSSAGLGSFLFTGQTTSNVLSAGTIPGGVGITVHPNSSSGSLHYASSGALTNNGTISLISANNSYVGLSVSAPFTNNGTFNISAGGMQSTTFNSISTSTVSNNGVINLNANTSSSNITNFGTVNIAPGTSLTFGSSSLGFQQSAGNLNADTYYVGGTSAGANNDGYLNVTGGSVNVTNTLKVWSTTSSVPLTLNGGSITTGTLDTNGTPSNFQWISGTLTINGSNPVVEAAATSPFGSNLNLTTGLNLVVAGGSNEIVGLNYAGFVTQSGGTNSISAALDLGVNTGSSGTYTLSGSGSLTTSGTENIGLGSMGLFNQTGGTHSVASLVIGTQSTAIGTYLLSGGNLTASVGTYIGQVGIGTFTQTGGTQLVRDLGLGTAPGGLGTMNLSGGSTAVNGNAGVGGTSSSAGGTGILNVATGGSLNVLGNLTVFDAPGNLVNVSGGSLTTTTLTLVGGNTTVSASSTLTVGTGGLYFTGNDSPTLTTASGTLALFGDLSFTGTGGTANIASSGSGTVDLEGVTRTFNIAQSSATVSMAIASNITHGSIIKAGPGTLLLSGANTFTGSANVSAGTLELGSASALGGASGTTVYPGATLDLNGQTLATGALTLYGTGVAAEGALINSNGNTASFGGAITLASNVAVGGYGPITISGAIGGSGGLSKIGFNIITLAGGGNFSGGVTVNSGELAITSPISFTGGINLAGGTLAVAADADLGDNSNGITLSSGGTLEALSTFSSARTITALGGTLTVDTGQTLTLSGSVGGSGPLNKAGGGTLVLTQPSSISGTLTISAGTLSLAGAGGALPDVGGITVNTTGTLLLDSSSGNQSSNPQDRVRNAAPITLAGGTLSLVGSSTAATTEALGQLILNAGASTININADTSQTATLTFASLGTRAAGGTLAFNGSDLGKTDKIFFSSGFADGQHLGGWATVNGTDWAKYSTTNGLIPFAPSDYTYNSFVTGTDTYLLSNYSGNVPTITVNTLNLNSTTGLTVTQNAGTTLTLGNSGLLKQGAGSASIGGGTLTSSTGELDISVNGAGTLSVNSALVGNFVLTERGSGTLVLGGSANNNYSGFTLVSGNLQLDATATAIYGTLIVDGGTVTSMASNQLDIGSSVILNSGMWNLQGHSETIASFTNNNGTMLFQGGILNLSSGAVLAGGTTTLASTLISPVITITGGTNQVDEGGLMQATSLMVFNASNPALQVQSDTNTPGRVVLNAGVNLDFLGTGTATLASVGSATLPGQLNLSGSTTHSMIVTTGSTLLISAAVTNGGFEVHGGGTVELTAANNYSGGTTISTATTLIAANTAALGSSGSAVTLNGGTLALRSDSSLATFPYVVNAAGSSVSTAIDIDRVTPIAGMAAGTFLLNTMTIGSGNAAFSITGNDGGTLVLGGTGSGATLEYNPAAPGPAFFHTTANLTINGPLTSTGAGLVDIYKDQTGTMSFTGSGSNVFGNVTVTNGTLLLSKTGGAIAIPGNLNISGGATVRLTQPNQISSTSAIVIEGDNGASLLDLNGNNNTFGSGGVGGLSFLSGGTLSTGTGTATLGNNLATLTGPTSTATALIEGNLNLGSSTRTITVAQGAGGVDLQIAAAISGGSTASPVGITKAGAGTLYLSGANTFTGPILVTGGVLEVNSAANLGNSSNVVTLDGGTLQFFSSFDPSANGGLNLPASSSLDTQGNTVPIAGSISGAGALTKLGLGTLVLKGTNSFAGLSLTVGTVQVASDSALGATGAAVTFNGGTLAPSSALTTSRQFLLSSNGGSVNASAGTLTLNTAPAWAGNFSVTAGTISFSVTTGSPTITGSPTLTISPGATVIDGGTIDPLHPLGDTAVSVIDNSVSSFDVTNGGKMAGTITGSGNTNVSTGATLTATNIRQGALFAYGNVNITPQTGTRSTSATVSALTTLTLGGTTNAWTGRLDLANNDLIVHSGSLSTLTNQFMQSYASGTWAGNGGIYSSSAAADTSHLTTLGIIQNNENGNPIYGTGTPLPLFDGQVIGASDILLKYTYYGDTDLNGKIDGSDYSRIDNGYLNHLTGWINGDFNDDGVVDGSDYSLIDNAYNSQGASLAAEIGVPDAVVAAQVDGATGVPEPTMAGLMALAVAGLLGRRSRLPRFISFANCSQDRESLHPFFDFGDCARDQDSSAATP